LPETSRIGQLRQMRPDRWRRRARRQRKQTQLRRGRARRSRRAWRFGRRDIQRKITDFSVYSEGGLQRAALFVSAARTKACRRKDAACLAAAGRLGSERRLAGRKARCRRNPVAQPLRLHGGKAGTPCNSAALYYDIIIIVYLRHSCFSAHAPQPARNGRLRRPALERAVFLVQTCFFLLGAFFLPNWVYFVPAGTGKMFSHS
jgi:hypothetical protein